MVAADAVSKLRDSIRETFPCGSRFSADGATLAVEQSTGGGSVTFDCSNCLETIQSSAKPDPTTGIPSGQFTLPEIDWAYKNVARIEFDSNVAADYVGNTFLIDQQVYQFVNGTPAADDAIAVDISTAISGGVVDKTAVAAALYNVVAQTIREPSRVKLSGNSIEFQQSTTGEPLLLSTSGNSQAVIGGNYEFLYQDHIVNINGVDYKFTNTPNPGSDTDVDISGITWGTNQSAQAVMNRLKAAVNRIEGANSNAYQTFESSMVSGTALDFDFTTSPDSLSLQYSTLSLSPLNDTIADYDGTQITIGANTYTLMDGGVVLPTDIDISGLVEGNGETTISDLLNIISAHVNAHVGTALTAVSGTTLVSKHGTLANVDVPDTSISAGNDTYNVYNYTGIEDAVYGYGKNNGNAVVGVGNNTIVLSQRFSFNGEADSEDGAKAPAIRFRSDGTPMYINVNNMSIEWANGSQDMVGSPEMADKISLFMGNSNTPDGMTHLSGDFIPNYLFQDGAKFGNFAGVSIGQNGIVTALFDNGDTRPIAQIPLATFTNPNGMEGLTGNAWIETDFSGMATLRTATQGGAGDINAATLESSTVDLGEEFSTMITTQRAYSAAAKIITTADEMLDELIRIKR